MTESEPQSNLDTCGTTRDNSQRISQIAVSNGSSVSSEDTDALSIHSSHVAIKAVPKLRRSIRIAVQFQVQLIKSMGLVNAKKMSCS